MGESVPEGGVDEGRAGGHQYCLRGEENNGPDVPDVRQGPEGAQAPCLRTGESGGIMTDFHGNRALAAKLRTVLGSRARAAAVATVCRGELALASVGAPLEADFEIGSVSKGITGLLYADALGRGTLSRLLLWVRCWHWASVRRPG